MSKEAIVAVLTPKEERVIVEEIKPEPDKISEKGESTSGVDRTVPAFSIYEKMKGKPYSAEYLGLKDWDISIEGLDMGGVKAKVKEIENWISKKIENERLEDTVESYQEIMENYKRELNIPKTAMGKTQLDRIHLYVQLLSKQKKLDDRRSEILGGIN